MEDIVALLIPIFGTLGLFTAISLGFYFKYKTSKSLSERVPPEAIGEWYKAGAEARAIRKRGAAFRWGGFLVGAGLGTAIGCVCVACGAFLAETAFNEHAIATFFVISLALLLGGAGMIGAYFLERKLDRDQKHTK